MDIPPAALLISMAPAMVAVNGDRDIHLGGDVGEFFHQYAVNGHAVGISLVCHQPRTEQCAAETLSLFRRGNDLHAAGQTAPSSVDLSLYCGAPPEECRGFSGFFR